MAFKTAAFDSADPFEEKDANADADADHDDNGSSKIPVIWIRSNNSSSASTA